jgi:hypothetical protein
MYQAKYDAALEVFRAASRAWNEAKTTYHARLIGDAEFLIARKAFDAAQDACDAAESELLNA